MDEEPLALDQVTPNLFEAQVGATFQASDDSLPFTLTGVRRLAATPGQPREQPFALDFTRTGAARPQGIVALHHDDLGTLEVFLVPVASDGDLVAYEAVFN